MGKNTKLAIVVPCFNEEGLIKTTATRLSEVIDDLFQKGKISDESFIYFVNDGSTDNTWNEIKEMAVLTPKRVKGIKFSVNFGNQKALLSGITGAYKLEADAVVTIDADLQQDENRIENFIDEYDRGAKIVFGIRNNRKTDDFIKKTTALAFYKLMNLLGVKMTPNHSDYRLVAKEVLEVLQNYNETDLFLRGFFQEVGFKTAKVYFDVKPREIGKSKFNLLSLTALAVNAITSYSIVPLKLICVIGFLCMIVGFISGVSVIYAKLAYNTSPDGWTTTICLLSFFGGLQLFCLGIVGEYLGQIFREVKHRPRYIIEEEI